MNVHRLERVHCLHMMIGDQKKLKMKSKNIVNTTQVVYYICAGIATGSQVGRYGLPGSHHKATIVIINKQL